MKTRLWSIVPFFALAAVVNTAGAQPVKLTKAQLDNVVAGTYYCPPTTTLRGNNGWGNGTDPTNPGSFSGATAPSKSTNSSVPAFGSINVNPSNSPNADGGR